MLICSYFKVFVYIFITLYVQNCNFSQKQKFFKILLQHFTKIKI